MRHNVPFNRPFLVGKELSYIEVAVRENNHLAGNGPFTQKCMHWLEENLNCQKALLTHTCTSALEMAGILCDIKAGDEVIMPSFTFVTTATSFALRGAIPVFIDIRKDTLNIDEKLIEDAITEKTKAIVAVHYAGFSCDMDSINRIAEKHDLYVIEDAAQGFYSKNNGKYLGTLGDIGCMSFHETKNIISGEGGAILINNERLMANAEIVWEKGTNRVAFSRGTVDKYWWVGLGSSFMPSEMVAAFLYAQLEHAEKIIENRMMAFDHYYEMFASLEKQGKIVLPVYSKSLCNGHIFYIITKDRNERDGLIDFLSEKSIQAVFHFIPLHSSPAGQVYGRTSGSLHHTVDISERLLRLPLYYGISLSDQNYVIESIYEYYS